MITWSAGSSGWRGGAGDLGGALDVPRTVATYPSLYSYLTYVPSNAIPEYAMLRKMAVFVKRVACKSLPSTIALVGDQALQENPPLNIILREIIGRMRSNCVTLSRKINELPRTTSVGELSSYVRTRGGPYLPSWFHGAYKAYSIARRVSGNPNYKAGMSRRFEGKDFVLLGGWRLYELFIMLLVLDIFAELGYSAKLNDNYVELTRRGKTIRLLFNGQLDSSIIKSVDGDETIAASIRGGRPDVSIQDDNPPNGGKLIVIDGKFSRYPAYITAGRFKVMAYMYEYNADLGMVMFPGLNESRKYDEEDEATARLWMKIKNKGYSEIVLSNEKRIYMVRLDPGLSEDPGQVWRDSRKTLEKLLRRHVT